MLMDRDVPAEVVANHLGHADLSTVMNYAKMSPKRRQKALTGMQDFLEETIEEAQPKGKAKRATPLLTIGHGRPAAQDDSGWPLTQDQAMPYLSNLIKEVEGQLTTLDELTARLAGQLTGPPPNQATPFLRVIEGAPTPPRPARFAIGADDWRDIPGACEVRAIFLPTGGVSFELYGDPRGIVQALKDLGALIVHNPQLPGMLVEEVGV